MTELLNALKTHATIALGGKPSSGEINAYSLGYLVARLSRAEIAEVLAKVTEHTQRLMEEAK